MAIAPTPPEEKQHHVYWIELDNGFKSDMGSRGDYLPLRVQGGALLKWRAFHEADLRSKSAQRAQSVPRRGTLWEGGARLLTARYTVTCGGKTHWEAVRIGAQNRANTHSLRQLGALRRCKKRIGLS
ncbi:MAG: hypothetical protein HQM04_04750 [Magnetococcales bacterium]|nr:hypothetical protein [Magnetococcales bacterium]MBF0114334.1 hypothetical protein [Magnetococcales bacterium]